MIAAGEFGTDDIGYAAVKPTPNGGTRDIQLGEKIRIARLTDRLADLVVVASSREKTLHAMVYRRNQWRRSRIDAQPKLGFNSGALQLQRLNYRMFLDVAVQCRLAAVSRKLELRPKGLWRAHTKNMNAGS